ncbi:hypothetical protein BD779DRAFT_1678048 [Infundibulicybe gibba]|nr:hypothetical protein BD779DRAFT_1678048 [Infundibulicybe gibba]
MAGAPPSAGPPVIPHSALVAQQQGQAALAWSVGAFCIFGWEWLVCLPQEYRRVWKKPMTSPSLLYLVNRYFGLLQFSFVMTLVGGAWAPGSTACKHMFYWEPVGALISTLLSQLILGSRVYVLYSQSRVVGGLLGAVLLIEVGIGGYSISTTSTHPPSLGPPGTGPPCGAATGPRGWLIAFWAIPLLYDALTFLLTSWRAYRFWKQEVTTPLFDIIWRDGVLYFFAVFSMNVANMVIFLTVPKSLQPINLTPTLILEVILSCRLFLNLRGGRKNAVSGPHWHPGSGGNSNSGNIANPTNELRCVELSPSFDRLGKFDSNSNTSYIDKVALPANQIV